jgi:glycosyltransferase A (GT-A) superfamily protein (DUF2064 family)
MDHCRSELLPRLLWNFHIHQQNLLLIAMQGNIKARIAMRIIACHGSLDEDNDLADIAQLLEWITLHHQDK